MEAFKSQSLIIAIKEMVVLFVPSFNLSYDCKMLPKHTVPIQWLKQDLWVLDESWYLV